jgi:hypothetical protein
MKWPGLVIEDGKEVPVTRWDQYALAINAQHGNAQATVWHDFWVC